MNNLVQLTLIELRFREDPTASSLFVLISL